MRWRGYACRCVAGLTVWALLPAGVAAQEPAPPDAWQAAQAARQSFEAEPREEHTRDEFVQVMDNFRAIYHGNPADLHAARAVDQVAELLAEQGRELNDRKSLRAAAGQYEFLAKAYPGSSLAAPGLGHALELLGPDAANDPAEAAKVREALEKGYPRSAAAVGLGAQGQGNGAEDSAEARLAERRFPAGMTKKGTAEPRGMAAPEERRFPAGMTNKGAKAEPAGVAAPEERGFPSGMTSKGVEAEPAGVAAREERGFPSGMTSKGAEAELAGVAAPEERGFPAGMTSKRAEAEPAPRSPRGTPAVVTGIRHWSTASYTRVAIDLGGDVQFQAGRVEHPDRIFFDLHGAKLAPGLAGKTFAVTDDGYLKTIRAGQFGADVTRVVLDVAPVAEYSAFLLPNPYRLIIDIHGKAGAEGHETASTAAAGMPERAAPDPAPETAMARPPAPPAQGDSSPGGAAKSEGGEYSTLPPMPVTDGSSSFGLPSRRTEPVSAAVVQPVARPRVVISAKPTTARPVPNAVSSPDSETGREVARVSDAPGMVEATAAPTSRPVVEHVEHREHAGRAGAASSESNRSRTISGAPVVPPPPTAEGQSTLMRALGLKIGRIVIDAGHGGHDSGTLGADGIEEKDVVLDVALRLGKLLHDRLGSEVVYTRADDTFIPLETRTAIANKAQADLFISVHANSSQDPSARGVEVYYLNFTSDPEAMQVASRENAVSSQRVNQLSDLVKKIALKDKIDESRELASDVDQSLYGGLRKGNGGLKDRGVKKAPFVVLIGANMPSILAEISFVTNPEDATELNRPEYRERVAESLYNGVARYAGAINGAKSRSRVTERAER